MQNYNNFHNIINSDAIKFMHKILNINIYKNFFNDLIQHKRKYNLRFSLRLNKK